MHEFKSALGEPPHLICRRSDWAGSDSAGLRECVSGAIPRQATRAKTSWNDEELRVLFELEDTHIWATHTERDAPLYEEEVAEFFFDPAGDLAGYFEIEINPLNAVLDLVVRKNRSGYVKNFAWRCEGLRTVVSKSEAAWSAEFAIPFRSVAAAPPRIGDCWRVNFCRIDRPAGAPRELSAWSPTGRTTFHAPERFGVLEFAA